MQGPGLFMHSLKSLLRINLSWYHVLSKFSSYIYEHWRLFVDLSTKSYWYWQIFLEFIWKYSRGRFFNHNVTLQQHSFNGRLSGTTQVSRYQKGKTNLDFLEQEIVSGNGIILAIC